jgi:hypothetical protein
MAVVLNGRAMLLASSINGHFSFHFMHARFKRDIRNAVQQRGSLIQSKGCGKQTICGFVAALSARDARLLTQVSACATTSENVRRLVFASTRTLVLCV